MKNKQILKNNLKTVIIMLLVFAAVDCALGWLFGSFLSEQTFTGIRLAANAQLQSGAQPPAGFSMPERSFLIGEYFSGCTKYCLIEDVIITLIFAAYLHVVRRKRMQQGGRDKPYFWMLHICVKILLNINSLVMLLGTMEYSRASLWETVPADDPLFSWALQVPENCFSAQRDSLTGGLFMSVVMFSAVLLLPLLSGKTSNEKPSGKKAGILHALLSFPVRFARKMLRACGSKQEQAGKTDLSVYSVLLLVLLIIGTGFWAVLGIFRHAANMNTLFKMQYSAIVKFLIPVSLTLNELFLRLEAGNPEKYVTHRPAKYVCISVLNIAVSCGALMIFSEFGSIISVLALSVIIFVYFIRLPKTASARCILLSCTLAAGVLIGGGLILSENALMQSLADTVHTALNGKWAFFTMDGTPARTIGWLFICITAAALVVCGIASLGRKGFLLLFLIPVPIPLIVLLLRNASFIRPDYQKVLERLPASLREHDTLLLLGISAVLLLLSLLLCMIFRIGSAVFAKCFKMPPLPPVLLRLRKQIKRIPVSLGGVIFISAAMILYFNFGQDGFQHGTILRSFYFEAGNFSGEYEITPDITAKRIAQTESIWEDSSGNQTADNIRMIEETDRYFNVNNYHNNYSRRLMRIIDRLCFSSRTDELTHVLNGLRSNMGFQYSSKSTYLPSLQNRYYVTRKDYESADAKTKSLYESSPGKFRDGFSFGKISESDTQEYLLYSRFITKKMLENDADLLKEYYTADANTDTLLLKQGYDFQTISGTEYLVRTNAGNGTDPRVILKEERRIFKYAEPETACSDYALYTLSRIGVGNALLIVFIPYFTVLLIMLVLTASTHAVTESRKDAYCFVLRNASLFFAVSFIVQTVIIICGVFGVSLFSGLSLPLVAKGNFEMWMNGICCGIIYGSITYSSD